jgi:hypothetical protein
MYFLVSLSIIVALSCGLKKYLYSSMHALYSEKGTCNPCLFFIKEILSLIINVQLGQRVLDILHREHMNTLG